MGIDEGKVPVVLQVSFNGKSSISLSRRPARAGLAVRQGRGHRGLRRADRAGAAVRAVHAEGQRGHPAGRLLRYLTHLPCPGLGGHPPAGPRRRASARLDPAISLRAPRGLTRPGGQRTHRRPARRVRVAARAGGREPVHGRAPTAAPPRRSAARAVPVAELVRAGRVRELRGIGPGSRRGCASSSRPGEIAELAELERELSPGARRARPLPRARAPSASVEIAPGARRADAGRSSARRRPRAGCATCPGIGPKTEAQLLEALARRGGAAPRARAPAQPRARARRRRSPTALGGEPAGDARRWRDPCERLAVVVRRGGPGAGARALRRAAADRRGDRAGRAAGGRGDGRGRAGRAAWSPSRSASGRR